MDITELTLLIKDFKDVSNRLLRTPHDYGMDNLKRFLDFINSNEIIINYINENINERIDEFKRDRMEYFIIPVDKAEEISYVYQLLTSASIETKNYYNLGSFRGEKSLQKIVDDFNYRVVLPFVNHILSYLDKTLFLEKSKVFENQRINVSGSNNQINIATNNSSIVATQTISKSLDENILKLIKQISIENIDEELKEDSAELLEVARNEIKNEKPKKSILRATLEKLNMIKNIATVGLEIKTLILPVIAEFNKFL